MFLAQKRTGEDEHHQGSDLAEHAAEPKCVSGVCPFSANHDIAPANKTARTISSPPRRRTGRLGSRKRQPGGDAQTEWISGGRWA